MFVDQGDFNKHLTADHGLPVWAKTSRQNNPTETAFSGNLQVYSLPECQQQDLLQFFVENEQQIKDVVIENTQNNPQKVQFTVRLSLRKPSPEKQEEDKRLEFFATSDMVTVLTELTDDTFHRMVQQMMTSLFNFASQGSGWVLDKIVEGQIKFARFSPIRGSSYIALPASLNSEQSLLNIRNFGDHNCFLYCFTAWYHQRNGPELLPPGGNWRRRTSPFVYGPQNPIAHQASGDFEMPMPIDEINRFEKLNSVAVNIFR